MRILFIVLYLLYNYTIGAQIINPKEVAKRKAQDRTNNAIDRTLDKGLDKVEEGIGNIFKKKEKPTKEEKTNTKTSSKKEKAESEASEDVDSEQETTTSKPSGTSTSGNKPVAKTPAEQPKINLKPTQNLILWRVKKYWALKISTKPTLAISHWVGIQTLRAKS